ncbi:hypothetical protein [Nitrosomonas sp. Nm166]|uniref:hypothetical protein n=1 Tax=Nitrosomonas sp. Nm166 TaxID=1881054 RepID=UPI0008ED71FF|nr:hypothetical protein [Nitrosomonas sp. Nm166]SFE80907.1 hypothetical protein SAMN05428977_103027 [Nitrosomonas sp. Nm166]
MTEPYYARGITAENLRTFLEFWQKIFVVIDETKQTIIEIIETFFDEATARFSWCHLYEYPFKHTANFNFSGLVHEEQLINWREQLVQTPGHINALPLIHDQIESYFTSNKNPTIEKDTKALQPILLANCTYFLSVQYSLYCVLYHGCFMYNLIERVRAGDDKALFDAIRIDPTVMGCQSAIGRISKATRLQDIQFFDNLKNAIDGKKAKRQQENFQKMRVVFRVLTEAGALRLTDSQLRELFIEELKLYTANSSGGGSEKSLRKFADTYMKKNATT